MNRIILGDSEIRPRFRNGELRSIGSVRVKNTPLRNREVRFLPWFDSYDGHVFSRFRWRSSEEDGDRIILHNETTSNPDYPFMEERDSSGDVCLPNRAWDAEPQEAELRIVFEPAEETIDGRRFSGFRYHFEYDGDVPIHRFMDRQTWELGGDLDDVNVICRNLFDVPKKRVTREGTYSTVGRGKFAGALPGNLWGRWSLLPAFDMQTGPDGVMVAWFDRVSCIRSVVESAGGEDWVRYVDLHYFEEDDTVRTNPKTVLYCPDVLDQVETLNLWTRVHDREHRRARQQFGMGEEEPPGTKVGINTWRNIDFDEAYEEAIDLASEFNIEWVFIDSVFQNGETLRVRLNELVGEEEQEGTVLEKFHHGHMCLTLDFEVSETAGGEEGLRRLCERAEEKGVKIMSWMSAHYWPPSTMGWPPESERLGHGSFGVFAAKESGRHPDTGYAAACWTVNLNAPIREHLRDQILGVCRRTGLRGFLWDSFSNLGWWQVDYSDGSMRPQFDRMARLYAELESDGIYLQPEAIVSFTSHSACGLFGGNVYAGDLEGYAYNTTIGLRYPREGEEENTDHALAVLKGEEEFGLLFRCYAHRRIVGLSPQDVPREEWDPEAEAACKELFGLYREHRDLMKCRTVLQRDAGVMWENDTEVSLLFVFDPVELECELTDAGTGEVVTDGNAEACRAYLADADALRRELDACGLA